MSCWACFFEAGLALGYDGDEILASVSDAGGTIFAECALFGSVLTFVFTFCPGHRRKRNQYVRSMRIVTSYFMSIFESHVVFCD